MDATLPACTKSLPLLCQQLLWLTCSTNVSWPPDPWPVNTTVLTSTLLHQLHLADKTVTDAANHQRAPLHTSTSKNTQAQFYNKLVKFYKNQQKCIKYIKNSGKIKKCCFFCEKDSRWLLVVKVQTPKHFIKKQATPDFWNSLSPLRT